MTNEEKATEIAIKICGEPSPDDITGEYPCAEDAALDMAEWKDHQFKEYLEKKKASLSVRSDLIGFYSPFVVKLMDEIINELFPKSEETNNSDNDE